MRAKCCNVFIACLIGAAVIWLATGNREAKQSSFSEVKNGEWSVFSYSWCNSHGNESATFRLGSSDLMKGFRDVNCLDGFEDEIAAGVQSEAGGIEAKTGVRITMSRTASGWGCSYSGESANLEEAMAEMGRLRESITKFVLAARGCMQIGANGGISVDYPARVERYAAGMAPVSAALRRNGDTLRQTVERVATFLQAIPYDELNDVRAGYLPPAEMLAENRGDCDTKSVAMASILRNFGIETAFVVAGTHVFAAVNIPPKNGDSLILVGNTNYVVVDPTGPALLKVGEAAEQARAASGKFTVIPPVSSGASLAAGDVPPVRQMADANIIKK